MLRNGDLLGERYLIEEQIGSGGMSLVYKARCTKIGRNVAVKVLKPEFTGDEEFIKRFKIEAQAAGSLSHPNIVNIYDMGEQNGIYYIVMEYVEGSTLKELIQQEGIFSPNRTMYYSKQICEALVHAHVHHIVHCDIKPHNILVTQDNRVKVTDFGIAKAVSAATISMTDKHAIGSVHYFSPEQARGSVTDAKSDIYSLGIVMYEMITGKIPFQGDTPVVVALKHIEENVMPPSSIVQHIPKALEDIILKATQKHPRDRYASAREMLKDIQRAIEMPDGDFVEKPNFDQSQTIKLSKKDMESISEFAEQSSTRTPKESKMTSSNRKNKNDSIDTNKKSDTGLILAAILTSLLIMGILAIGMFQYVLPILQPKSKVIPNLYNLTEEQAREKLKPLKLELVEADQVNDSTVASGKILSQDPTAGSSIGDTKEVKVVISKGMELIRVPNVMYLDLEDAKKKLIDQGLQFVEEYEYSDTSPENTVMQQVPAEGERISKGDKVKLIISKGVKNEQVSILNIQGFPVEEAERILQGSNLRLIIKSEVPSNQYEKGKIISQIPAPYTSVAPGSTVEVTISNGQRESLIPDLVGKDLETAKQELDALEVPYTTKDEFSNQYDKEIVIAQSIAPQSIVNKDQTMVLTVSKGKPTPTVKYLAVDLPDDRDKVNIRVVSRTSQGEKTLFDQIFNTNLRSARIRLEGTGTAHIIVYRDDDIYLEQDITFN